MARIEKEYKDTSSTKKMTGMGVNGQGKANIKMENYDSSKSKMIKGKPSPSK